MAPNLTYGPLTTGAFTTGTLVATDTGGWSTSTGISTVGVTSPTCDHEMDDETELDDGRICGRCAHCGDRILGRRLAGGMGLAKLKAALVDALGDAGAYADLADELIRVERMVELEEQSIDAARRLLATARRMLAEVLVVE